MVGRLMCLGEIFACPLVCMNSEKIKIERTGGESEHKTGCLHSHTDGDEDDKEGADAVLVLRQKLPSIPERESGHCESDTFTKGKKKHADQLVTDFQFSRLIKSSLISINGFLLES